MLVGENLPHLVSKTELHLVAVFLGLCRTENRSTFGQLYLADTGKVIHYLTLFPKDLFFVWQTLPFATSAHAEMRADGLLAQGAHLVETEHRALHEMMLLLGNSDVDHITWNGVWHKDNHVVNACQRFTLCSHIGYLY